MAEVMMDNIRKVFEGFETSAEFLSAGPYGSGHINDTFAVSCKDCADRYSYILTKHIII